MKTEEMNKPAFSRAYTETNEGDQCIPAQIGLSKLEYFAARAPYEVPEWFKPVMPEPPKAPGFPPISGFYEAFEIWKNWEGEDGWEAGIHPGTASMVREHVSENEKYREKRNAFAVESYRQTLSQWPWAWARAVLEAKP